MLEKPCSYRCGVKMLGSKIGTHEDTCPLKPELCHFGCALTVLRKDLRAHRDECPVLRNSGGHTTYNRFEKTCTGYCINNCPLNYDYFDHMRIQADKQREAQQKQAKQWAEERAASEKQAAVERAVARHRKIMEEGDQTKGKMKKMGKLAMAVTEAEYDDTPWEVRRLYGSQQASTSYVPPKRPSIPTGPPPKPPPAMPRRLSQEQDLSTPGLEFSPSTPPPRLSEREAQNQLLAVSGKEAPPSMAEALVCEPCEEE